MRDRRDLCRTQAHCALADNDFQVGRRGGRRRLCCEARVRRCTARTIIYPGGLMKNPVNWFEIYVQDMSRAKAFYEKVLGVQFTKLEAGDLDMWALPMDQ